MTAPLPSETDGASSTGRAAELDTTFTPFPRPLPDDLLAYICAELHDMMEEPMEPLLEDQLIRKTLLSIQLVSRAGWKAATPFLWKDLKLTCDADYISVFAPITRLLHNLPLTAKGVFRSLAVAMVKDDVECPADVERFFKSTRWISAIHIRSPPPAKVGKGLRLAGHLARERDGTELYLGKDIDLYLGGDVLSLLGSDDETKQIARLHVLVKDFLPRAVTLWDLPVDRGYGFTWENLDEVGSAWANIPVTIHFPGPGHLQFWAHKSTTLLVGSTSQTQWHGDVDYNGHSSLSMAIGTFLANCMINFDPHSTTTELNVFVDMADSSGKRWILPLRPGDWDSEIEEEDEDEGGYEDEDDDEVIMRLEGAITDFATQVLEEEGLFEEDDFDRWDCADEIGAAFAAGRLRISSWSGERATEDVVLVE